MNKKEQIITKAKRIRAEIQQIRNDADHWNRTHPNHVPIDPDPFGEMAKIEAQVSAIIGE